MNETTFSYDSVNFHKTFSPQDSYIAKILELAKVGYTGSKEEISEETGIPTGKTSGKVVPHILYSQYMGLTTHTLSKGKYTLTLTDLGKTVLENDKYMFEDISRLICHYNICDADKGAYLWSFIYNGLPIMLDENISEEAMKKKYTDFFMIKTDLGALRKSYSDDGFFALLDLLDFSEGIRINSSYFKDERLYVYAYALFSSWDMNCPETQEITADQIIYMKWNKRFGFDEDEMLFALEQMEGKQLIRLNKQLVPYTVIRNADTANVLPHLYELLN